MIKDKFTPAASVEPKVRAEPPKPTKPSAAQVHDSVVKSLREMVRLADEAGQRDSAHVMEAKKALALLEPEPDPKPVHKS